jgi:hypothetical protein
MDPQILREAMTAYEAVYNEDLREEIDFQNWVNSLVEEGYDLSEYTWEEMYETYLSEGGGAGHGASPEQVARVKAANQRSLNTAFGLSSAPRNQGNTNVDPYGASPRKPSTAKPTPSSTSSGSGSQPYKSRFAGARDAAFNKAKAIQGSPVVGSKPSGSAPSAPATRPSGTAPRPSGAAPAAKPPAAKPAAPAARPASTAAARPAASAPTAKPAPTATSKPITSQPPESKSQASAGEIRGMIGRSMERQAASTPTAAAKPTPTATRRPMGSVKPGSLVSGFDMFDVVKGYLIDEGFAETEESAIAIMANMSEEWKLEIIDEAVKGESSDRRKALAAERRKGIKPLSAKEGEKYASHKISQMAYTKRAKMGDDD